MSNNEMQYEGALRYVYENGVESGDRTGVGTRRVFGLQYRYDLSKAFPLITSKRVHFKSVIAELVWMLSGSTNAKELNELGATIWDEWANEDGELGPIYGKQWRAWNHTTVQPLGYGKWIQEQQIDQIKWVVDEIRRNPDSRRLIVSAWNPADIPDMALAPCHTLFQFVVIDGKLHCQLYQRSADMFLGVPFNLASYALLTHMVAACTGLEVGDFVHTIGDAHIYSNHMDQVKEQLSRPVKDLPQLLFTNPYEGVVYPWEFKVEDFEVDGYKPHPAIKADVAV
jgi:thymidylate synthase